MALKHTLHPRGSAKTFHHQAFPMDLPNVNWPKKTGFVSGSLLRSLLIELSFYNEPLDTELMFRVQNNTRHLGKLYQDYLIENAQLVQLILSKTSDHYNANLDDNAYSAILDRVMTCNIWAKLKGHTHVPFHKHLSRKFLEIERRMIDYDKAVKKHDLDRALKLDKDWNNIYTASHNFAFKNSFGS